MAMLKNLTRAAFAVMLVCLGTTAEARRGGGSEEFMDYVADIAIPAAETGGEQMYVCHLIKKHTAIGIPLFYESEGYVLAGNRCDTDTYIEFLPDGFAEAQAEGLIAADVPAVPSISLQRRVPTLILGLLIAFGIFAFIRQKLNGSKRRTEMGEVPVFAQRLLEVMCHAAKSDGVIGEAEINTIAGIAAQVAGVHFDAAKIQRMIELSDKALQPSQFAKFAKGMDDAQKHTLMRSALAVVSTDGQLAKAEGKFISGLASGLSLSKAQFDQILSGMQAPAGA
jgi:uncharacterized tellurite resistance protein B-like protein